MSVLRLIAIVILVSAEMPWGAVYGAQASPYLIQRDSGPVIADPNLAPVTVSTDGQRGAVVVLPKPKRCRTAILLGSPCGPEIALPGSVISLQLAGACNAMVPDAGAWLTGVTPPGSLDPPRSC